MEHLTEDKVLLYEELCKDSLDEEELSWYVDRYPDLEDKARWRKLFRENIKLVGYGVRKCRPPSDPAIDYEDLYQEGYKGLWEACRLYNESKGKFSTYAVPYITGRIKSFMNRSNSIKVSSTYLRVRDCIARHDYTLPLSEEERSIVCEETGVSIKYIDEYSVIIVGSLDITSDGDDEFSLIGLVEDESSYIKIDYTDKELEDLIERIVSLAVSSVGEDKTHDIIEEWLYSALAGETLTLEELAKLYSTSRQNISQILYRAKHKLISKKDKLYRILSLD